MEFSLLPRTSFAPPERESFDVVREDHDAIRSSDGIRLMLDMDRLPLAVVNERRQIVDANQSFLDFGRAGSLEELMGMRLGECLRCVHAIGSVAGCGTHASCRYCGTVCSVLGALGGRACVAEVELEVERDGVQEKLCFDAEATPLPLRGRLFALLRIRPIEE